MTVQKDAVLSVDHIYFQVLGRSERAGEKATPSVAITKQEIDARNFAVGLIHQFSKSAGI